MRFDHADFDEVRLDLMEAIGTASGAMGPGCFVSAMLMDRYARAAAARHGLRIPERDEAARETRQRHLTLRARARGMARKVFHAGIALLDAGRRHRFRLPLRRLHP